MKKTTKHLWKLLIFVILNLAFLFVLLWSLMIYTSLFEGLPWYEPCGTQFLVIFFMSDPAFLIIGIALLILSRYYHISKLNKWLPFAAIAGLSLPLFVPPSIGIVIGLPIGVVLFLLTIVTSIRHFITEK